MKHAISVGDLVRVKMSNGEAGETRYQVVGLGLGTDCIIKEWPSTAPEGKVMAGQDFDTSLLIVDNSGPSALAAVLPKVG